MATLPTSGRPIPPAPSRANISRRQPDGTIYVTVDGDGSQATAGTLRALFDRVRQHRPALAIADLTDVAVMDIGGVEALARPLATWNRPAAGSLHNPPARIRAVLDSIGLATEVTASDGTGTHRRPTMGN